MAAPEVGRPGSFGSPRARRDGVLALASALLLVACARPVLPGRETPAPTMAPTTAARPTSPTLVRDVPLRASPSEDAREVAGTVAGTPVRLAGRLDDGSWFYVEVVGRLDALGWVPVAALDGIDATRASVPVVATSGGPIPAAGPGEPRDLPNLVLENVSVRQNQILVALSNDGYTDLAGPFTVTVNGGPPHSITLPGKPLRPGDRIDNPLAGEYVQRRATVDVVAATQVQEQSTEDNRLALTVEPDLPLDLEILTVVAQPQFTVTLRNNSPIPLVGAVTLTIRESRPSDRLLTRVDDAPLSIPKGGTQEFRIPAVVGADLTRIQVLLQTSAINDSDIRNDVYPR
ncbi:MAG: hypothetical protein IT299_11435 [Dehalococcoidia bacterium]|nr:hypothetical protein [Dehalococcoidia bacterium]